MNSSIELLNQLAGNEFAGGLLIKSTCLMLIAFLVCRLLKSHSAATRHFVWASTSIALIALPVFMIAIPSWNVLPVSSINRTVGYQRSYPERDNRNVDVPSTEILGNNNEANQSTNADSGTHPSYQSAQPPSIAEPNIYWRPSLIQIWGVGFLFSVAFLFAGWVRLICFQYNKTCPVDRKLVEIVNHESAALNMPPPKILMRPENCMPMVWGILNQHLVLPQGAANWEEAKRLDVVRHELAHLKRLDPLMMLVSKLTRAIYWFNPLAWLSVKQLLAEQERACDDVVLGLGSKPANYATTILEIATFRQANNALTSAMARSMNIEDRIATILNSQCKRTAISPFGKLSVAVSLMLVLAFLAPLAFAQNTPTTPDDQSNASPPAKQDPVEKTTPIETPLPVQKPAAVHDLGLKRAINYLESTQKSKIEFPSRRGMEQGELAITTLALLRSGIADKDKLTQALNALANIESDETYIISIQTIVFCESGDKAYAPKIKRNVNLLCGLQQQQDKHAGGWTYSSNANMADGSNSRFAVWALCIANQHGYEIPNETFQLATKYWLRLQSGKGWPYTMGANRNSAPMTLSGIACLSMLKKASKFDAESTAQINNAIAKGWKYAGIENELKINTQWNLYGWQTYALACKQTNPAIANLDNSQIRSQTFFAKTLHGMQKPNGTIKGVRSGFPRISTALAIIALTEK